MNTDRLDASSDSASQAMADSPFSSFSETTPGHFSNPARVPRTTDTAESTSLFLQGQLNDACAVISAWPGYAPTPLLSLAGIAEALGVAQIKYKDEGSRFGLGSFKSLGGAYAVSCLLESNPADASSITVASATDGNHGLSVAWGAKTHGCQCVIFIHAKVSAGRERALKSQGATVIRIDGNYDDSVTQCYREAESNGWLVISDTSKDDAGADVARLVMAGYSVMAAEIVQQTASDIPTHVFVQGGVGGLAATVCEYFRLSWGRDAPRFVIVEPALAPCLFESAKKGERVAVDVRQETVMAGLSCGEVSTIAWPTLHRFADDFLTITDAIVAPAMRMLADSVFGDESIVAGESAVAGLAGFISARRDPGLTSKLQLDRDSRILLIGTEGATDPVLYESLTGRSVASVRRARI